MIINLFLFLILMPLGISIIVIEFMIEKIIKTLLKSNIKDGNLQYRFSQKYMVH